eukprot:CAMPEP_0201580916 /NCGR_PEP_ID=MMETSP0190_2-20130828/58965_1 /ASSEMBLY_ACC=CAM_ASM_000263 /TAXON_ID=37353 /ORGANISM="Rosalina sp." /LENGTH=672 /DNA_ID=CAMNT_0048017931 /DNA_START=234 /DNA_END=2252 /DNA_ORIENTATION=-
MTQDQQARNTEEYVAWIHNSGEDDPIQRFEYWIYNITNPYDVPNGVDPVFDLLGPFVFKRLENKTNVIFYEDPEEYSEGNFTGPIVEFDYIYEFEYLPEESTQDASLEDEVFTMSGAMQGLIGNINGPLGGIIPNCVYESLAKWPGVAIFYNGPIYNLTYGMRDPYVEGYLDEACANDFIWPQIRPNTEFSLLPEGDNHVYQYTGKGDRSRVAELIQFRNFTTPPVNSWKLGGGDLWCDLNNPNQPCHEEPVYGSRETRQFPPREEVDEDSELIIWSIEKFRQTVYKFEKDVTFKGVELMRFRLDDEELKGCIYEYNTACSDEPTPSPSDAPTAPTEPPTTATPTTAQPTISPTLPTTAQPTESPTIATDTPSMDPTMEPTTAEPTSASPTESPTITSDAPSQAPTTVTVDPTGAPTMEPTIDTIAPTAAPSQAPTCQYLIGETHTCKYFQFNELWRNEDGTVADGIANLTNLRGSPSFMSKGRFLDAPYFIETVVNRFDGLDEPEQEEDDQYFDIDPKTGIVFRNFHNYQMNFQFYELNIPDSKQNLFPNGHNFSNFEIFGTLMPFAYIRVEAVANDDQMEFYKDTLDQIDLIKGFSLYGGPALAVVFFGLMFFILCKMRRSAGRADLDYGRLVEENNNHNNQNKTVGVDISMQKSDLNGADGYGATGTVE